MDNLWQTLDPGRDERDGEDGLLEPRRRRVAERDASVDDAAHEVAAAGEGDGAVRLADDRLVLRLGSAPIRKGVQKG